MKNPLPYLALLGACLAPLAASAQSNAPPGYRFNNMFPGMFGGTSYTVPQGYMNRGQSPFLTMPAPQSFYAAPQGASATPSAPVQASPMAQPIPFWMQPPANQQPRSRFITDIPSNVSPQNTPPAYTVFSPPGFRSRWAPLPGQAPAAMRPRAPVNNWTTTPDTRQSPAPAPPATPPKWPDF